MPDKIQGKYKVINSLHTTEKFKTMYFIAQMKLNIIIFKIILVWGKKKIHTTKMRQ